MHENWIACTVVLLSFFPTFHFKHRDKNSLSIKDRNLVIQTVMSDADNASINCPGLETNQESAHITLHKETELTDFTDFQKPQVMNTSKEKQKFRVHVRNNTVDYVIDMPRVNDTGLYNCTVTHGVAAKTTLTFLLVTDQGPRSCLHEGQSEIWLPFTAACVLLALYNIIITIVSYYFARKLRQQDTYQNDYFNTRPGEFSRVK